MSQQKACEPLNKEVNPFPDCFLDDEAIRIRLALFPKARRIVNTIMTAYDSKNITYLQAVREQDQARKNGGELAELIGLMMDDLNYERSGKTQNSRNTVRMRHTATFRNVFLCKNVCVPGTVQNTPAKTPGTLVRTGRNSNES